MNRTGYVQDNRYMLHDTGPYHPEMAERLTAIHEGLVEGGLLDHLVKIQPRYAELKWIEAVHAIDYIRRFEEACLSGRKMLDFPDNQMCQDTYETALLAVGGVLEAARLLMAGDIRNA